MKRNNKCTQACEKYRTFINQWKPQYQQQSKKFTSVKDNYTDDSEVSGTTHAYQYIEKKIRKY